MCAQVSSPQEYEVRAHCFDDLKFPSSLLFHISRSQLLFPPPKSPCYFCVIDGVPQKQNVTRDLHVGGSLRCALRSTCKEQRGAGPDREESSVTWQHEEELKLSPLRVVRNRGTVTSRSIAFYFYLLTKRSQDWLK